MGSHIKTVYANALFFPVVELLSACSLALLVWWGGKEAIADNVTYGNLVAFILYIYMLFRPIRQLADRFNVLQMGMVGSERVFKVLDTVEHIDDEGLHISFGEARENPRCVEVDTIVLCAGQLSERSLADDLEAAGRSVHVIGGADVAAELDAKRAINQGTRLAATL